MMTSSSQKEGILKKNSILPKKDPPEGKTTAIVAVVRGRPNHGHHRQCSNKHYKQKLLRVLLDSGSNGNLIFIDKDKPMLLPSSKRLVPQSWNTSNGMFQTKRKAEIELNFFEYSNSKRYPGEPDIVQYNRNWKILRRILAFLLHPRYIRCTTTCLLPSLSKKNARSLRGYSPLRICDPNSNLPSQISELLL